MGGEGKSSHYINRTPSSPCIRLSKKSSQKNKQRGPARQQCLMIYKLDELVREKLMAVTVVNGCYCTE